MSFLQCVFILNRTPSQEKPTFPGERSPCINRTNSKTFSDSNAIWDLAKFFCTIFEVDFDVLKEHYGDIENDDEKKTKYCCLNMHHVERICPSRGSFGQTRSSLRVDSRSFSRKGSARNGGVLQECSM